MTAHDVHGTVTAGFELVREEFAAILAAEGTDLCAQVAAYHRGQLVVDLWAGAETTRDSLLGIYSASKGVTHLIVALLVQDGVLDLDQRVSHYWPEFGAEGKRDLLLRQLLSHQAGVVLLDQPVATEAFYDWDYLCGLLAAQEPLWPPGTAHGESALFYGHLVGELVRRVDGRGIGRFLREEICGPHELDFAFGLSPAQQARAVDLAGLGDRFEAANAAGRPALYRRAVANPPGAHDGDVVNSARWRAAEIPAINGHGTARAVAGFYQALAAGRLLSVGMLAEAIAPQCGGPDQVFGEDNSWGLGFGIDEDGYGMGGLGGNYGGTSTAGGYSVAFVTGTVGTHARSEVVENALRDCLGVPPLPGTGTEPQPGTATEQPGTGAPHPPGTEPPPGTGAP